MVVTVLTAYPKPARPHHHLCLEDVKVRDGEGNVPASQHGDLVLQAETAHMVADAGIEDCVHKVKFESEYTPPVTPA